jgi:hypothetical protein
LFVRVQELLDANQVPPEDLQRSKATLHRLPRSILAGMLICDGCGFPMTVCKMCGQRYYRCSRYHEYGRKACGSNHIAEKKLLRCIVAKIQGVFRDKENREKLRAEVKRQLQEDGAYDVTTVTGLRQQLAEQDARIGQYTDRLLEIPKDLMADCAARLREHKQERSKLAAQIRRLETKSDITKAEDEIGELDALLARLHEVISEAEPMEVRAVLKELVSRVELHFRQVPRPGKTRSIFERGVIYLRQQESITLPYGLPQRSNAVNPIRVN